MNTGVRVPESRVVSSQIFDRHSRPPNYCAGPFLGMFSEGFLYALLIFAVWRSMIGNIGSERLSYPYC